MAGIGAVVISQILIFSFWQDARFGTIPNVIILLVALVGFAHWQFEQTYQKEVRNGLERTVSQSEELITEKDLQALPAVVQNYLTNSGVVGKPRVRNIYIEFEGEMRGKDQDWFSFTSEQYNFFHEPGRFFFMKARVKGLPAWGYHAYDRGDARMLIKLLSVFLVVNADGHELDISETVTFFNDLCLFAPAALVDAPIVWEEIDALSVKATYSTGDISISAILQFDESGRLTNFHSDDRYDIADRSCYRFSTPVSQYQNFLGYTLPGYGEAILHYPEGAFVYGKFRVKSVVYNNKPK